MKLREYLTLKNIKPYQWAKQVGLPQAGVYVWLSGTTPNIENIMKIKLASGGAVGPEDWINGK